MSAIATLTMNPALDMTTQVDKLMPTHKLRCTEPRFDPGGGGINVARVIQRLGGEVVAIFPSGGHTGKQIEALLADTGVKTAPVPITGITRESVTVDDAESGLQYRFVLPGPALSDEEQAELIHAIESLAPPPGWLVASGSLPPGCDPALFPRLAAHCRKLGARLVIDTSGPALAACKGAQAYLLKPSLAELEGLIDRKIAGEAEEASAARTLIDQRFAEAVVLSLGERGALLVTAEIERRFAAIRVEAKSSVGAGDSMVAAITLALAEGRELVDAVRYGIAAGAATLMTEGTQLACRDDVERLYAATG
jgi:6-phosphofructokinase 2